MTKRNIKKALAILLIFTSLLISIYTYYNHYNEEKLEDYSVEVFLNKTVKEKEVEKRKVYKSKTNEVINYIAVLEIPKLNLKKGLVDPKSSLNNVGSNITILSPISMPIEKNHTFILAAHSGTAKVSYFNELGNLSKGDSVFVYYKNKKYIYKITNYYSEKKTGTITIKKEENSSVIVLTSCSRANTKQLTYIGTLIKVENYND